MRAANYRVDRKDEPEPPVAAARWLGARVVSAPR
jgi:hypothetical protein